MCRWSWDESACLPKPRLGAQAAAVDRYSSARNHKASTDEGSTDERDSYSDRDEDDYSDSDDEENRRRRRRKEGRERHRARKHRHLPSGRRGTRLARHYNARRSSKGGSKTANRAKGFTT